MTVADEFGFTIENAPRFTTFATTGKMGCLQVNIEIVEENVKLRKWYEAYGAEHIGTEEYDFFSFTCGYMRKML